jgi:hypothetical protein
LSASLLGHLSSLDVHHIFPKAQLYKLGVGRGDVNAVANFCFLTKQTNIDISASDPAVYMPMVESQQPGALASQWIPRNPDFWRLGRFKDFLSERRRLLAEATNALLSQLAAGGSDNVVDIGRAEATVMDDSEEAGLKQELLKLVQWLVAEGYAEPEYDVEVADPETGAYLCTAEALWRDGLQEGIGSPVVLELDGTTSIEDELAVRGYRVFTSIQALRRFVEAATGN